LIGGKFVITRPHEYKPNNTKRGGQSNVAPNNEEGARDSSRAAQAEGQKVSESIKKLADDYDRLSRWMASQINNLQRQIDDIHEVINKPLISESLENKQSSSSSEIQ
jgi:endonuclease IV